MANELTAKLTAANAKRLLKQELGITAPLTAKKDLDDVYQTYSLVMGCYSVVITNASRCFNITMLTVTNIRSSEEIVTYFDTKTMKLQKEITRKQLELGQGANIKDAIIGDYQFSIEKRLR